jgi:hypothetical protein
MQRLGREVNVRATIFEELSCEDSVTHHSTLQKVHTDPIKHFMALIRNN